MEDFVSHPLYRDFLKNLNLIRIHVNKKVCEDQRSVKLAIIMLCGNSKGVF
jgi:hypothetical protein